MTAAEFRAWIAASRVRQGFPATVQDLLVADRLAAEIVAGRVEGSGDGQAA